MPRYFTEIAIILLAGAPLLAGELDREFQGSTRRSTVLKKEKTLANSSPLPGPFAKNCTAKASELDREGLSQAWRRGWGGWGWAHRWGLGRMGLAAGIPLLGLSLLRLYPPLGYELLRDPLESCAVLLPALSP